MDVTTLGRDIEGSLASVPVLDAHTHLDATHLTARGLHDILLYHMVVSDLVSAGCPDRDRLSEKPSEEEARARIERAVPFLPGIAGTSCAWGVRIILEDLFGWKQPVTAANWRTLDGLIRERGKEKGRARSLQPGPESRAAAPSCGAATTAGPTRCCSIPLSGGSSAGRSGGSTTRLSGSSRRHGPRAGPARRRPSVPRGPARFLRGRFVR